MNKTKLDIYPIFKTWTPIIEPASPQREWMERTADKFAYRCLPLAIANAHGWVVKVPQAFSVRWNGQIMAQNSLEFVMEGQPVPGAPPPASVFGNGVLTFHIGALFQTSPGWNLIFTGPFNDAKHGIYALSGVLETDWMPFEASMNWRFTEPNRWVRFEAGDPYCFLFPVPRTNGVSEVRPRFLPIESNPYLQDHRNRWSASRDQFHADIRAGKIGPKTSDHWQRHYHRGLDMDGNKPLGSEHQAKLRLHPVNRLAIDQS